MSGRDTLKKTVLRERINYFEKIPTWISCHFSSVERNEPHDFTKSNSVVGAFRTGTDVVGKYEEVFEFESSLAESDFGKVGLLLSRGVKSVLRPDARNMPPPT